MRLKYFDDSSRRIRKFYFIGIGGISMSALAKFLSACGYEVAGSDAQSGEQTEELSALGVRVTIGGQGKGICDFLKSADAVVYTDAIAGTDEELTFAKNVGKRIFRRAELLNIVCGGFAHVTAVAGSHGKTTCTAMCAHILKETGVAFAAHIGGEDSVFGNFYASESAKLCDEFNDGSFFVTEACEYKKNLLKIDAEKAVLLNIDRDHMECYASVEELADTFGAYCRKAKTAFVCADDERCVRLGDFPSFGVENPSADYRAADLRQTGEKYAFTLKEYGKELCRVRLNAAGRCNVYNALAAFAVMRSYGFSEREICRGLENFTAVKRRFESIGKYAGAYFICDYAHHPREIAATIATAEKTCRGTLYVVFQPHTYSRTKLLMKDFVRVLRSVENLMIYKTYPAREYFDEEGSAYTLSRNVGGCLYAESVRELKTWLKSTLKAEDTVLFLGAGDIYYAARYLLKELNK